MPVPPFTKNDRVLILGATGFVGSRLIPDLAERGVGIRLLARNPQKVAALTSKFRDIDVVTGDFFDPGKLDEALQGIHTAYYFLHSLGGKSFTVKTEYVEKDRRAAQLFMDTAESAGLKRVIYLGGLGEAAADLSDHLRSRAEVGTILLSSKKVRGTVLRAAVIIGAGGASFEMLRYLVERLPVMVCPKWIDTRIQPIAIRDVTAYLAGCLFTPETEGRSFDICGPDILTYREMMQQYCDARGLSRRLILTVPVLTPLLSAYWVDLVTPVPSGLAHPLILGLKNEVVCKDNSIQKLIPIPLTPYQEAVKIAYAEETSGPGITGW